MRSSVLLALALVALLSPPGAGLLVPLAALALGGDRREGLGLLLLGLAPLLVTDTAAGTARRDGAITLDGRWRAPPGRPAFLQTAAGPVSIRLAGDLPPPAPGTPVTVLARLRAGRAAQAVALTARGDPAGAWLDRWAAQAARRVRRLCRTDRRGLVMALVLGRRDELPHPIRRRAIDCGTMHLFALSGLHVALLVGALGRLLGLVGLGGHALTGGLLGLFVALAGAGTPLLRASLGWALLAGAGRHGRSAGALHRLGAVALLLVIVQPGVQHQLSARLSFLAVAGFLAGARLLPGWWSTWSASAGAFLVTAPLCAETFGVVQPWGVVVTPLLLPLVTAVLLLGLVAVVPGDALAALDPVTAPLLDGAALALQQALRLWAGTLPAPLHPVSLPVPGLLASGATLASLLVLAPRSSPLERWVP